MQTEGSKDFFCSKKLKSKDLKLALLRDNGVELLKKKTKKRRRSSKAKDKNILESKKNRLWSLASILWIS